MSVPTHEREQSLAQFVETARVLNVEIAQTVANGPKKYMLTYGDRLVNLALDVYSETIQANSIHPSKGVRAEADYLQRRAHLIEARAKTHAVAALAQVYFEVLKAARGLQRNKGEIMESDEKIARRSKLNSRMERIGAICDKEIRLISGVLKSDTERFRKYNS
ncbi:MAG: hypothetical protein IJ087_00275 [Eggerthellaceae bacterium]|nr:hypothetical protein [Eggerthellaceae bacterium]